MNNIFGNISETRFQKIYLETFWNIFWMTWVSEKSWNPCNALNIFSTLHPWIAPFQKARVSNESSLSQFRIRVRNKGKKGEIFRCSLPKAMSIEPNFLDTMWHFFLLIFRKFSFNIKAIFYVGFPLIDNWICLN